jgi:solute carrier family 26 (sodium-independent sulfate anion transporter), member 11
MDVTSIQGLIDVRNQLDKHAEPEVVEWHFANVSNRWTRRALAAAGFGYPSIKDSENLGRWKPIFSVAATDATHEATRSQKPEIIDDEKRVSSRDQEDVISPQLTSAVTTDGVAQAAGRGDGKLAAIQGMNRPFFHIDVAAAVESAVLNAESKREVSRRTSTDKSHVVSA